MKKSTSWIILFLLLFLVSCDLQKQPGKVSCTQAGEYDYLKLYAPGAICNSDTCARYQTIWKELIMEKNNLSEQFFSEHIELCLSNIGSWDEGVSFNICYKVKLGWAIAYNCDQFIVKIKENTSYFPTLNVPRGVYLTKDQIRSVVNHYAYSSYISKISNTGELKFNSLDQALDNLIQKANVNTLCSRMITINYLTGDLILEAGAQYDNKVNTCIDGKIDLITGETSIADVPCAIN
jgi:hypothetical protein